MGKIVVSEFMTLDGVMEAPGGEPGHPHTGWVMRFADEGQYRYNMAEVFLREALLLGRITYESFEEGWSPREGEFADRINSMPKYVVSSTMGQAGWKNSTVINGDVADEVRRLRDGMTGDLLVNGSRTLVNYLKAHDLVDEYRLMVFPIVLGSGKRLFDETPDLTTLNLTSTQVLDSGVAILHYDVIRGSTQAS